MIDVKYLFLVCAYFLFILAIDLIFNKIYSKKCGYDCSKCNYWPCSAHVCNKKRASEDDKNAK